MIQKNKKQNRLLSMLLVLVMLLGIMPVTSITTFSEDITCEECEYINGFCAKCGGYQPAYDTNYMYNLTGVIAYGVANAGQLYWVAEKCNSTGYRYSIWLLNDIKVNSDVLDYVNQGRESELMEWTPISPATAKAYDETIYGNGHTISGLYVGIDSDDDYVGLIGAASKAKVQNLRITDSYFASTGNTVGAFCGRSDGSTYTDCYNEATVVSNEASAGLTGASACDIFIRCGNGGTLEVTGQPIGVTIGGIAGSAAARMVTGDYATADCSFDKCFDVGTSKYNSSSEVIAVGPISGQTYFGKYTNCYYDSGKYSNVYGGVAQATHGTLDPTITDCEGVSETQLHNGSVCEKIGHLYFDGECVLCGNECSGHSFSGTNCTECGMGIVMVTGMDAYLPANVVEGESVVLTGTVYPTNASYRDITWSVTGGDATISGNKVTFNKMGTVVLKATVKNGLKVGKDYTQSFSVTVRSTSNYNISQVSGTTYDYRMTITESDGKLSIEFDKTTYYVDLGTQIVVTGSKTGSDSYFGITVHDTSEDVNLTLKDCTIQGKDSAIEIKNAALNLTLDGSSSLESNQAAIWVSSSASIVIDGTGSLKAQSTGSYPAIGSSYADVPGDITINGGTITANGGTSCAAIGGYYSTNSGNITINGGNVTAVGGAGTTSRNGGGAGIGGGTYASGGTITINGGTVNATGGNAYVGSNTNSEGGAAGIGGGYLGRSGNITINGGIVNSTGSAYGAGIGSGQASSSGGSLIDTIKITGGTVTARGINLGSGIGGGMKAYGGNIIISGGNINASSARANAIGKGGNSPRGTDTSISDGNGNSISMVTYAIDGLTTPASVKAITGCKYGVNDVYTLDTNKLYFYLPSGGDITTVTTESGTYICKANNIFCKDHEYSADCDYTCNRCGERRDVSVAHEYENGVCKNCGAHQPAVWNDSKNYYEIYDANQLFWFSEEVNSGRTTINGKLMADIDASSLASFGIGTTGRKFAGTFDGNGYTVTIALDSTANYAAPFPYVNGATIKNLTVTGSIATSHQFAASLVGQAEGDVTIEKCLSDVTITSTVNGDGTHGGLVGVVNSGTTNINNCGFFGQINGSDTNSCGGFVGWSSGTTNISNSYVAATFGVNSNNGNTFSRGNNITLTNCYYLNALNSTPDGATQMDKDAFNSGEVTYRLNNGVTDGTQVWYQTLTGDEKQDYPNFSGKTVYSTDGQYVNAQIITIAGVTAEDDVYNGLSHKGYTGTPTNADGYTGTYEVKYTGRNGTTYSSTEAPVNAGDYTVTISTDSEEAQYIGSISLDFTIAKKDVTVTAATQKIAKGEDLSIDKVTVGTLLEGHTATVTAVTKGANCEYTATIVIKDGNENDVTANYEFDATGTYHEYDWDTATHGYKCINCTDVDKTDSDMPAAEYQIGTSGFKKFINTISFGLFCKDYKTVEITSVDNTSGVKTTQYYISSKELSETELAGVTWCNYTDKLSLNAKGTYFIYVKVTDNAGNTAVYNSEGIVIFEDSTASVDIEYTRTTNTDVKANIDFNGNTVKEVKYGTSVLTIGTDYTVTDDGITFTAAFLETLAASDTAYTVTVSYNAGGEEWGKDSYGTKAADTVIAITVKLTTGSVTVTGDVSKTYDGNAVSNPTYTSLSTGNATYEYKVTGADDSTYTTITPKTVGTYTVRVTVATDGNYDEASGTADFTISAKEITVTIAGKTSIYGDDIVTLTATDNGIVSGDTNVYSLSTTASKTASVGTYDITGTALDVNYSITFTGGENAYEITKRELTVTVEIYSKQFDGLNNATVKSVEINNIVNGDSVTVEYGDPTFDSVNAANGIGITFTYFILRGDATVLNNYTLIQPTGVTADITNGWFPAKDTEYTASTPNENGWLKEDMTVTANDGYELSLTNTADGSWGNTLIGAVECADGSLKFYVRNKTTGAISEQVNVDYKLDKNTETTGTNGKVEFVGRKSWQSFVNTITFGLFYKDEVTVKAEATDGLSGVDSIEYAVSDKAMSLEEVRAITDWTEMPKDGLGVTVEDEKKFVYFIRITDKAGNVTYLSTDGAEYDTTLPAIDGVENGGIYHTTKVVTVTDKNLESITLNGEPVAFDGEGKLTLDGNLEATYVIKATDKAGNVTEYTVTTKSIADITDPIKDITADDVTGDDRENIETAIKDIEKELENDNLTDEEKAELEDEKQKAEELIEKIEEAIGSTETDNTDKVKDITSDNVKTEDKSDLDKAKDDLEKALDDYKDNLTDDEKKDIQDEIERIENALEVIDKVEKAEDLVNKLPDDITESDADAIKAADEAYNALSKYEQSIFDTDSKNKLDNAKSELEALNKGTSSPGTGDNSHLGLWITTAIISATMLIFLFFRKRRKQEQ